MMSTSPKGLEREKSSGYAFAVVIALLTSLLVVAPVSQVANASGAIVYNDGVCDLTPLPNSSGGYEVFRYEISSSDQLWEITDCSTDVSNSPAANIFSLTSNIDVTNAVNAPTSSPIGSSASPIPFTGILDGGNHKISSLNIESSGSGAGLFATLGAATISNLIIEGTFASSNGNVGALTGTSVGSVHLVSVSNHSTVSGTQINVGGLVGEALEPITFDSTTNHGPIRGTHFVGGFVGHAGGGATIQNSTNYGQVSASGALGASLTGAGGFIGQALGDTQIVGAANIATVSGQTAGVGGFVGDAVGFLEVVESENTGAVTGFLAVGGFVGSADDVILRSSANFGAVSGSELVGGFVGFATLRVDTFESRNQGAVEGSFSVGGLLGRGFTGTIVQVRGFENFGQVSADRTVGGVIGLAGGPTTLFLSSNSGTVSAVVAGTPGVEVGGLVGLALQELEIEQSSNSASVQGLVHVGGLVGFALSQLAVTRAENSGSIEGLLNVGGLLGSADDGLEINESSNYGEVSALGHTAGGLVGSARQASLNTSVNAGEVRSPGDNVGGLIGKAASAVTFSRVGNIGSVSGNVHVGGLIGLGELSVTLFGGANNSKISGLDKIGGLIGASTVSSLIYATNLGRVEGRNDVGGLIGTSVQSAITSSRNLATVSASAGVRVGGLLGDGALVNVRLSYNSGQVFGTSVLGGLVGRITDRGDFESVANNGAVTGTQVFVGGLVGQAFVVSLNNTKNTGAIYSNAAVGGLIGYAISLSGISRSYNVGSVGVGGGYGSIGDFDGLVGDVRSDVTVTSVFSALASRYVSTSSIAEMRTSSTFVDFDFTNTWGFGSCSDNGGFPMLRDFAELEDYNSVGCGFVAPTPPPTDQSTQGPVAPAPTAYNGPVFDFSTASGVIGTEFVMTGQRLGTITSLRIGEVTQVLTSVLATAIRFTVSASTKLGLNDIVVASSFGVLSMPERIRIEAASLASVTVSPPAPSPLIGKTRMLSKNDSVNRVWFEEILLGSGIKRLLCTSVVSQNSTNHQRVLARKQASRTCSIAAEYLTGATTWVQTKVTQNPRGVGRVLLTKRG